MFCIECGTQISATAKFCFKCGTHVTSVVETEPTADSAPEPTPIRVVPLPSQNDPQATPEVSTFAPPQAQPTDPSKFDSWPAPKPEEGPSPIAYEPEEEPRQWWQNPLVWVGFAGVLFAFLAWGTRDFWLGTSKTGVGNTVASTSSGPVAPTAGVTGTTYYAIRKLKLRDKPTTTGSQVKGEVQRGATLSGEVVFGEDQKSQWLKINGSGFFVSLANLSEAAPPLLKITFNKAIKVDEDTVIRQGPSETALQADNAPADTTVEAIGVTNDGWIEIALKQSGVGYFKPSATSANAALVEGKPTTTAANAVQAVNFDNFFTLNSESCDYGPQMNAIFGAITSNANGVPFSINGTITQYKSTRSGDPESPETTTSAPIGGKLKSLNVTGMYVAYEGQGLYFSDSVDAVGKALSTYGFMKQDDGSYATDAGGVGGYVTNTNGKTTLYCGA